MESLLQAENISNVIELAVAPVFLLASISGALNVMSLRLGRIIDRGRRLNEIPCETGSEQYIEADKEQRLLARRARQIHQAITLSTVSSLFVCLVIVVLFLDALFQLHLESFIALLFIVALLCLIVGLLIFLKEISLSTHAFKFGRYKTVDKP
jgi:amino acid transporter